MPIFIGLSKYIERRCDGDLLLGLCKMNVPSNGLVSSTSRNDVQFEIVKDISLLCLKLVHREAKQRGRSSE